MRCVAEVVDGIEQRAWVHHIQRLVVLGNLAMLAGVSPQQMARWMAEAFIDGAEWVMLPNVIGMAMWADGGRMATKPHAARWRLHRPDERLLPQLPVRTDETYGTNGMPVHDAVLGFPCSQR